MSLSHDFDDSSTSISNRTGPATATKTARVTQQQQQQQYLPASSSSRVAQHPSSTSTSSSRSRATTHLPDQASSSSAAAVKSRPRTSGGNTSTPVIDSARQLPPLPPSSSIVAGASHSTTRDRLHPLLHNVSGDLDAKVNIPAHSEHSTSSISNGVGVSRTTTGTSTALNGSKQKQGATRDTEQDTIVRGRDAKVYHLHKRADSGIHPLLFPLHLPALDSPSNTDTTYDTISSNKNRNSAASSSSSIDTHQTAVASVSTQNTTRSVHAFSNAPKPPLTINTLQQHRRQSAENSPASTEVKTPSTRRPPASRSSRGTGTENGPPPALSTQRTKSLDNRWRIPVPDESTMPSPQLTQQQIAELEQNARDRRHSRDVHGDSYTDSQAGYSHRVADAQSMSNSFVSAAEGLTSNGNYDSSLKRRLSGNSHSQPRNEDRLFDLQLKPIPAPHTSDRYQRYSNESHEDVFLTMAQQESPSNMRSETHGYTSSMPGAYPGTIPRSRSVRDSEQERNDSRRSVLPDHFIDGSDEDPQYRHGPTTPKSYAKTAHPAESRTRQRFPVAISRTPSDDYVTSSRLRAQPDYTSPSKTRAPQTVQTSAASVAPSTVWDELDELKSRIKKLEITGVLPPSSTTMNSNERPTTAGTTTTTMSSSPRRTRGQSISPITSSGFEEVNAHPLLQSALSKSKGRLSHGVYKALEIVTNDAMTLTKMTTPTTPTNIMTLQERQLKRKIDSMCRSLTELCIVLNSEAPDEDATLSAVPVPVPSRPEQELRPLESRAQTRAPQDLDSTSNRVMSRLAARRTSVLGMPSPVAQPQYTPETYSPTAANLNRSATRLNGAKTSTAHRLRNIPDDTEVQVQPRAMSRAFTEVGPQAQQSLASARAKRFSREITASQLTSVMNLDGEQQPHTPQQSTNNNVPTTGLLTSRRANSVRRSLALDRVASLGLARDIQNTNTYGYQSQSQSQGQSQGQGLARAESMMAPRRRAYNRVFHEGVEIERTPIDY